MVEGIEDDVPEEQYESAAEEDEDVLKDVAEDKQLRLFVEGLLKKLTAPYISSLQPLWNHCHESSHQHLWIWRS